MAKVYVYSTMSSDNCYANLDKLPNGLHKASEKLLIAGKANVSNPNTLITPKGMMTTVEDTLFEKFENNPMLKRHIERGFITVQKTKKDIEDVVKDMEEKDNSAQATPDDLAAKPKKGK